MLKWIGAVLVIAGAGLSGLDVYLQKKKELEMTEAVLKTLRFMKDEMRYTKTLIGNVFSKCATLNSLTCDFYKRMSEGLREGKVLSDLWRIGVEQLTGVSSLLKAEMLELGEVLGTVELDMQDNILTHTVSKIEQIKNEQKQELETKGKLYSKIGFGIGALVVILLI